MIKNPVFKCVVVLFAVTFLMGTFALPGDESQEVSFESKGFPGEMENPLDILVDGVGATDGDAFGWNISFIGDVNNDNFEDLGVGAPLNDVGGNNAGAVYIFFGDSNAESWANISAPFADVVITGQTDELFGWDLDAAGDVNNDGVDDLIVGAPDGGTDSQGKLYLFFGSAAFGNTTSMNANRELIGRNSWGYLGFSVTGCGDMDSDGFDDVAAGAPYTSEAVIFRGFQEATPIFIDLWDDNTSTPNVTQFETEVNNTPTDINTFGFDAGDDGWDWASDVYIASQGTDMDYEYAAPEAGGSDADGTTIDGSSTLQVMVGCDNVGAGPTGNGHMDSGAWGIEIYIDPSDYSNIASGWHAFVQFDYRMEDPHWYFDPSGGATEEYVYLKSRFTNDTGTFYLGRNLINTPSDTTPEVDYVPWSWKSAPFGPIMNRFKWDVTRFINGSDHYYWDFGALADFVNWANKGQYEGISAFFDNITMWLQPYNTPIWIQGESMFGWDVDGGLDVNNDNEPDLIVAATGDDPYSNYWTYRGCVYLFPGKANLDYQFFWDSTDMFIGESNGGMAGYSVSMVPDVNGDGFDEVLAGAPVASETYLWYGRASGPGVTSYTFAPWDDDPTTSPINVSFEIEANNTDSDINTFGIYGNPNDSDDGWDWAKNVYGGTAANDWATLYSPQEPGGPDTGTVNPDNSRRVGALIQGMTVSQTESAAWGCQFNITSQMLTTVTSGGMAYLVFNYEASDPQGGGQGTEEPVYVKARAGDSNATMTYLGHDLDGGRYQMAANSNFNDPEPEVWFFRQWWNLGGGGNFGTRTGRPNLDFTDTISNTGAFYIDFGILQYTGTQQTGPGEGVRGYFDNVVLVFYDNTPMPDVVFQGAPGEAFGHSVDYLN
jgi:hypothetical protein